MRGGGLFTVWIVLLAVTDGGRPSPAPEAGGGANPDAARLRTGHFLYRAVLNGEDAGNDEIVIRRSRGSGNYIYTNQVRGQSSQRWEAVATPTFLPISATLAFGEGADSRFAFDLKYRDGRVTGFAFPRRQPAAGKIKIDTAVTPDTVDQRIDWAAAMSVDLVPGREFAFHVFDPGTGISRVAGRVVGPETVHVPAGTFDAMRVVYRIEKAGGTEVYQILTNRQGLRILLKEEFPTGEMTELVEIKN